MKIPLRIGLPVLLIVIMFVLLGGCTGKVRQEAEPGAGSSAELGEPFRPITLEEGLSELNIVFTGYAQSFDPMPLYYFQARGISRDGKAEQWIFGIKYQNDSYFALVESNRVVLMPGQPGLPTQEIFPSAIVQPGTLITTNSQLIGQTFSIPESSLLVDIEMSEYIYTITPRRSDVYKILYFNARSGEQL